MDSIQTQDETTTKLFKDENYFLDRAAEAEEALPGLIYGVFDANQLHHHYADTVNQAYKKMTQTLEILSGSKNKADLPPASHCEPFMRDDSLVENFCKDLQHMSRTVRMPIEYCRLGIHKKELDHLIPEDLNNSVFLPQEKSAIHEQNKNSKLSTYNFHKIKYVIGHDHL